MVGIDDLLSIFLQVGRLLTVKFTPTPSEAYSEIHKRPFLAVASLKIFALVDGLRRD